MRALLLAIAMGLPVLAAATTGNPPSRTAECEARLQNRESGEWSRLLSQIHQELYNRLAPYPDPFVHDLTLEAAQAKFEALSFNSDPATPNQRRPSILGETREYLRAHPIQNLAQVTPLLEKIAAFSRRQLADPAASRANLYRASVALDLLLPAIAPFLPRETVDQPLEQTNDAKNAEEKKAKQPEPGQQQPATYPQEVKSYKPHTKNTDQPGPPDAAPPVVISDVNVANVPYFILGYMNTVARGAAQPFQASKLPGALKPLAAYSATSIRLKINLIGQSSGPIAMPMGYEPLAIDPSRSGKIVPSPEGGYRIEGAGSQTEINLIPETLQLDPLQMEALRRKVGVGENEWPSDIRFHLLDHLRGMDPMTAARKVETYLRNEYLYSVGARSETDPIDALKAKAFQCDMAAYIMVAIMRDVLDVPCRPAWGFRGQTKAGEGARSVVQLPTDLHAFVQCFDNGGNPRVFDPTPKKQDKEKQNEGAPSDVQDNEKEFKDDKPDEPKKEKPANEHATQTHGEKPVQKTGDPEKDKKAQELDKALQLGTLSLKNQTRGGALESRVRHLFLREASNLMLDTTTALQRLNKFKNDQGNDLAVQPIIEAGETAFGRQQRAAVEALYSLAGSVKKNDVHESFKALVQLEDRIRLNAGLQDEGQRRGLDAQLARLREVKEMFRNLNDRSRIDAGVAEKFFAELPPITKGMVREKYKLQNIGGNIETQTMMKDLTGGGLRDQNLIRTLYPLTDFITDATPAPAYKTISLYEQDRRHYSGREFMPVTDMADSRRAIRLQPEKSFVQNFMDGTLFLPVTRRRVNVPDPGGKTQPRRVTIVVYDTSGSMDGAPGEFQAGLIAAFADRALSDRSDSGVYRHKLMLLGFDDRVHTTVPVRNADEARRVIRDYRKTLRNTQGGTDIKAALSEAVNQILAAEKEAGEPLASANVILMSDGGAAVDAAELKTMFARVNRKTPLRLMFAAINGSNPELVKLTDNALQAGAANSFYKEFTAPQIGELLAQGSQPPRIDLDRELYTGKGPEALPANIDSILGSLAQALNAEVQRLHASQAPRELQAWLHDMSMTPILADDEKPTAVKAEINRVRSLMYNSSSLKGYGIPRVAVDDIMKNFQKTFGKKWDHLMVREREEINHMINEAIAASNYWKK